MLSLLGSSLTLRSQFAAKWALLKGASRVILVDGVQWRLDYAKSKLPKVELLNYNDHKDVSTKVNEMTKPEGNSTRPEGFDVALECAGAGESAGGSRARRGLIRCAEFAKGWARRLEMAVALETDTSEPVNECIKSVVPFGEL